jgi:predicted unusual protein kinase regulating ubiquinone biosynthesis (AarF/ABC1/UbiB family)
VHRAVTHDGREVAVKVQYPGVDAAIESDLDNAEALYRMAGAFVAKGLDSKALVDELRARMRDELDYRLEAANQIELAEQFAGHPFVSIPAVDLATSRRRVLTSEWVDGWGFDRFLADADRVAHEHAGESIWRFAQHAIHRLSFFNGDPHPGNYKFDRHGKVTFLDFGLVKRWSPGEWERLRPSLDGIIVDRDPEQLVAAMEYSGFLREGHGLRPDDVYAYVSAPYRPYLTDTFRFDREFVKQALADVIDVRGPYAHVIEQLDLPPSFVVLDRVVWGVSAILGKIDLERPWRAMLLEYLVDGPPATALGEQEARWRHH